ncbi:hypothetical protein IGB42_01311 [Andreprevotia sp. IGB-42]|uniref:energy transducer TonB n=1 Tax=Andreprevotia sp. IGB-42 TaxID=2497473 RepID=UPI0013599283|nr:energy transducer TonB [Andreprevotia sp. IGB-42]KAF0814410.1 hypothetical protein IGB42_01311 [Andreprevotia sp. IGB-42]
MGTVALVIGVHAALLLAIWSSHSEPEPEVEAPTLAYVELPVAIPEKPAPEPKPQPKPQPKVEKAPQKPAPKPLPKAPVELPKSETAPVIPEETAKPKPEVKEVKEVAAPVKAPEAPAAPVQETPSQPTVQAGYMSMPRSYPAQSRILGEEGTVVVKVMVSEEGKPISAELFTSSGFSRLDEDARRTVMKWRFNPAKRDGKAVALSVNVPVRYSLSK